MTEADTSRPSDARDHDDGATSMQNLWAEVRGLLEDDDSDSRPAAQDQRGTPTRPEKSAPSILA